MEAISMSVRERKRLVVLSQVQGGKLRLRAAGELLGVSYRQVKRVWSRYQADGDRGLVHGLRGKRSNRQSEWSLRERVLARYAESSADYGPTLAAESLGEEGLTVAVTTLRRWLVQAGLWQRRRVRKQHRRRRERKEFFGELVQMDGSHHDWFEGRRAWAVLMAMIDDATGRIYAQFFEEETLEAAFTMFGNYAGKYGFPQAIYVDRAGIYRSDRAATEAEILAGKEPQTQFGWALEELDVQLILARSPQAKGRVERMNGTLQDRLVKAMRRRRIADLATANQFLDEEFLTPFNAKFGKPPGQATDLHRAVPQELDLPRILSEQEERVVQNDWTVRWRNAYLQLGRASGVEPGQRVVVCAPQGGRVRLFAGDRELAYGTTRSEPRPPRAAPAVTALQPGPEACRHASVARPASGIGSGLTLPRIRDGVGAVCSAPVAGAPSAPQTAPTPCYLERHSPGDISNGRNLGTFLMAHDILGASRRFRCNAVVLL